VIDLDHYAELECCDVTTTGRRMYHYSDASIGLTRQAWTYDVPAVVIELVEQPRR
jgi:hypothetical protein